jgi:hypothetical protein
VELWGPPVRKFIDDGLKAGIHRYLTDEEVNGGRAMEQRRLEPVDITPYEFINDCEVNNKSQDYLFQSLSFAAVAHFVEQHIKAVSDGASTGHIMSLETANELISNGVIPEMLPIPPGTRSIVFGKEEATEPVIGEAITTGVLDRVLVVNDIAITLISETSLTKRGVIFLKDDTTLIGLLDSRIVVMGRRDPNTMEGSVDQLWNIDLRSLFRQPGFDSKEGVSVLTREDR